MMDEHFPYVIGAALVGIPTVVYFVSSVVSSTGLRYWLRYLRNKIVLSSLHKKYPSKLPSYERLSDTNFSIYDVGIIPSESEYRVEYPCHQRDLLHNDGIHFFGVDADQNFLDIYINKIHSDVASVWIFLQLSGGDVYRNSLDKDTRTCYIDNENLFYSSGLQIKCLSPLRRWRISFNGLLQKDSTGGTCDQNSESVHVKFSFVWLAMSVPKELNIDIIPKELSKAFSDACHDIEPKDLDCFHAMQNRYEQWGQLMGTLNIKGSAEKELYLWSCRTRIADYPLTLEKNMCGAEFFMYFSEGYPLRIESIFVENFLSNYTNAYSITGFGGVSNISDCDFDLNILQHNPQKIEIFFKMAGVNKILKIEFVGEEKVLRSGPNLEWNIVMKSFTALLNDQDTGYGVLHYYKRLPESEESLFEMPTLLLKDLKHSPTDKLISMLTDEDCKSSLVAGGKGCSLALLTSLSKEDNLFEVPKGFVITTFAFDSHIKAHPKINLDIKRLIDVAGGKINVDLKTECDQFVKEFQIIKLREDLKKEIQITLLDMYDSLENVRFSVRSSACGEDSEDLSAAGQMLTILGVRGINNIFDAVIKCWSSKFGFEAVQYAKQNGQAIRSSMAVVIQEMVPSDVAGVMFTVNPVTGDPSHPYITANYGLGETVVSSLVEPDTFVLKRDKNGVSIYQKIVGAKRAQIHMTEEGGTQEKILDCDSSNTCLTDEWALQIGSIGILIENCFCGPRDIEWAVHRGKIFLLQARPVTTLHTETDFELIHDQDTPSRSNNEFWTSANTGEVYLGASSPYGISTVIYCMDILSHRGNIMREGHAFRNFCPYYLHILPVIYKHVTLSIIDVLYRSNSKTVSNTQKGFEVALFGRLIGTEEMHKAGIKKYGYTSKYRQWLFFGFLIAYSFKVPSMVTACEEKVRKYKLSLEKYTNIQETWEGLHSLMLTFFNQVNTIHGLVTYLSSIYNLIVITSLAKEKEVWDSELYCEFASVLSACSGVESADIPQSLQELAQVIVKEHKDIFPSLSQKMAYETLMNDKGSAGELFRNFLKKHGHRCIKEFDPQSTSWAMDPESLMPTLQNMIASPNILNMKEMDGITVDEAISKVKTPLQRSTRKLLQIVLPWSRQAVRQREQTKSMLIKAVDWVRQISLHLGKFMVEDGMLPYKELLFFLTLDEVHELFSTRKPGLVPKALRRSRLHSKLNALQFPEITRGIPKPVSQEEDPSKYSASFTLKGIPVCQGKVRATAKVVMSVREASSIKSGEILITHATDIGWSPYFPLLSGVVTVLGGLISHGAVVAREYGLPCVVGVQEATSAFKSGDTVILDGYNGTVSKVSEEHMN